MTISQNLSTIKKLFIERDIRLRKSLGQNLLIDGNILRLIAQACELSLEDIVFEVGPGTGALTQYLVKSAFKVYAIEIDDRLMEIGKQFLTGQENLEWVREDVLKYDFQSNVRQYPGKKFKIVGNLPYYITTPILMRFLEEKIPFERMVVMMQKEVAERILAKPGSKDYGVLTLMIQYRCAVEKIRVVSRNVFYPVPDVDSIVLRLKPHIMPKVTVSDEEFFIQLIRTSFQQRRKTLINALQSLPEKYSLPKTRLTEVMKQLELSEQVRGETLSMEHFARLSNKISEG